MTNLHIPFRQWEVVTHYMTFAVSHKYIIHKLCFLYCFGLFCSPVLKSVWSGSPVALGVCSVRPAACCYSRDHWREPRTCCSCLKQTVYFSWELGPRQLWHLKTCLPWQESQVFVVLFNSVCGKTCSLSRSVWVNQSVGQMGPPQTIESDDIAPELVRQHSAGERAGNDRPPRPGT